MVRPLLLPESHMNQNILAQGRRALLALILLTAAGTLRAEVTYIHAGAVVDVIEARVRTDQALIVEDGRISAMGDAAGLPRRRARRIDLSDQTVLPGLIDAHVHLSADAHMHG